MTEIKVPGFIWALLIVVVVAVIHSYEPQIIASTPFNAPLLDMIVVVLMGILKGLDLTDVQLEQALRVIDSLIRREYETEEQMRGGIPVETSFAIAIPEPPSKLQKWLVG